MKKRATLLILVSVIVLVWNSLLSTRRRYYAGKMETAKMEDVILKVICAGKIEPKIQRTIQSLLDGDLKEVHVKEGDHVVEGQLLLEISDQKVRMELNQKNSAYRNAMADYSKAQKDFQLERDLLKQGAVPARDVENARQTLDRAGQGVQAARDDLSLTQKKFSGVKVTSPIDGVVLKLFVEDDAPVTINKDLVKVAQPEPLIVRATVDERDIAKVAVGQEATVTCEAYPGVVMPGKVNWIGAQAKDGSFADTEITVELTDTKGIQIKPNLSCETNVIVGQVLGAVVIPAASIRHREDGSSYAFRSKYGWLQPQDVTVDRISAGTAVIKSGINVGDKVLVPVEKP